MLRHRSKYQLETLDVDTSVSVEHFTSTLQFRDRSRQKGRRENNRLTSQTTKPAISPLQLTSKAALPLPNRKSNNHLSLPWETHLFFSCLQKPLRQPRSPLSTVPQLQIPAFRLSNNHRGALVIPDGGAEPPAPEKCRLRRETFRVMEEGFVKVREERKCVERCQDQC